MSRAQFCLGLFTAGLCLAFLCPGLTSPAQPVWEQAEERSGVLNQKASPPAGRIVSPATSQTLSRWRGRGFRGQLSGIPPRRSAPGGARTSLVSLTSTSSVLDTCGGDPDIEPMVISVTPAGINGPNPQLCSTAANTPYSANSNCSVGTIATQKASSARPAGQQAYCSTNVGGVVKYPGPLELQRDQRYDRECLQCGGGGDVLHASRLNWHNDDFQLFDLRDKWVGDGDLQCRQSVRQRKSAAGHVLFGINGPASRPTLLRRITAAQS